MKLYYSVVEIGGVLFGAVPGVEVSPVERADRTLNAARIVCRDLTEQLRCFTAPVPGEESVRARLVQHAQEVIDLVEEAGRLDAQKRSA